MDQVEFVEVAKTSEIPSGKMKHVEVGGKEIVIANLNGKFYALCDRCSHTNAPLSSGILKGNTLICAMHGAQFDVATGKKISDPPSMDVSAMQKNIGSLPDGWQKMIEHTAQLMVKIKTYDQQTFETAVDGDQIKVRV
ncbi:MAG: Rieske 2Fe-2S domain-containing protein [Thermoproteota archaeon]|nr:Rieske 2Fe-2S domain-containing protein [Thermoproteota archaeon]